MVWRLLINNVIIFDYISIVNEISYNKIIESYSNKKNIVIKSKINIFENAKTKESNFV